MNALRLSALSVLCVFATAAPALGEMKRLTTVSLTARPAAMTEPFPGKLERIGFRTSHGDAICDPIRAVHADGTSRALYHGLVTPRGVEVAVPAEDGPIERIEFHCTTDGMDVGVEVQGELGRFEADWRNHPDWRTRWWYRIDPSGTAATAARS